MSEECEFTLLSAGDAYSLRNALIPFASDLEQGLAVSSLDEIKGHFTINDVFEIRRGPTADGGFLTTIAIGLIAFVGGWAGNKFLDEVYAEKVRPRILSWLGKLDAGLAVNSKASPKQLQIGIWYEDRKVLVLVVVEAENFQDMAAAEPLVSQVHQSATKWIEKNGVLSPIHVYIIQNGKVNLDPMTFQTIQEFSLMSRKKRTLTISSSRPSLRSGD